MPIGINVQFTSIDVAIDACQLGQNNNISFKYLFLFLFVVAFDMHKVRSVDKANKVP